MRILRYKGNSQKVLQQWTGFAKSWGERNDTRVTVDFAGMGDINRQIGAEAAAGQGHDLIVAGWSLAGYEDQVIDHSDIYEECKRRYSQVLDYAIKSTYNPITRRFWGVCYAFTHTFVNYRQDLWEDIDMTPDTWEGIRLGGRKLRFYRNKSVGIPFSPGVDSNSAWNSLLYAFGGSVQDTEARPVLKSRQTLEALRFAKALYEEAMSEDVLAWDGFFSNNRWMLAGEGALTLNTISITRFAEKKELPIANDIWLAPFPQGPARRIGASSGENTGFIWTFAQNIEGAKRFLVDYIGDQYKKEFLDCGFCNFPCLPHTVPDLAKHVAYDANATPSNKYAVIADVPDWTTNAAYPGYFNPAISEVYGAGLVPAMFANATTGKMTPEQALTQADQEVRKIYDKWQALGKV